MTLTSALAKLHAAGRIRSQWLPGMRGWFGEHSGPDAAAGRLSDANGWNWTSGGWSPADLFWGSSRPDITDPATVGCLLALLREASGDPSVFVYLRASFADADDLVWTVGSRNEQWDQMDFWMPHGGHTGTITSADTEGAAISAAIVALAEAL